MPNDELTAGMADDLDGTFERLVLAYQDRLYGFALRMTGSRPDAEEVAQETFVRAYRALAGYPVERIRALAPRPWLYRIALNVVRNRARRWRPTLVPLDGALGERVEPPDTAERPEAAAERAEERDRLGALVATLPKRYRAAVVLRHVEDLGYAEVATLLGQPVGTVKANVHRGIKLLRDALQRDDSGVERVFVEASR